ncbi:hypothetical protein AB6A40_006165 [Gnathostoma spinigerum]|uniref:Ras-related protein Rab n=1 Tax=Gnathostoma spinigerum TaxID=75299 RepID=A0ABD6EJN6_9BILA
MSAQKRQLLFKILVIGDVGTGKSSIVRRYVHNIFNQYYKATVGVDFAMKVVMWDATTLIRLQLWDISGQDRFGNMTRVYYKDAHGAVIVFDATRENTYEGALKWKDDLDSKVTLADGNPVPAILLANKVDLENNVSEDVLKEYGSKNNFVASFRTSAKENLGLEDAFRTLTQHIIDTQEEGQYEIPVIQRDPNVRRIDATDERWYTYSNSERRRCC